MRALSLSLILLAGWLTACSSVRDKTVSPNDRRVPPANEVAVDADRTGYDLVQYLRRVPGVQIQGSGENAIVRVRDQRSFSGETDPLYVVNGTIVGTSFSRLHSTVDPAEIASIKVLRSASEVGRYGLQGGNGVIEITLK